MRQESLILIAAGSLGNPYKSNYNTTSTYLNHKPYYDTKNKFLH